MRSIPLALTWELLHRGRYGLLAAMLGALVIPSALLGALRLDGVLAADEPNMIVMHLVLIQINMFIFAAAIMVAQGSPARLYAFPATTATIVAWHLLPAMAVVALQTIITTAALNALFDMNWPLWGPALFVAVALAAVLAVLWLTEKSVWLAFAVGAVGLALGVWFQSRYGSAFRQSDHLWHEVTAGEIASLLAFAAMAFGVAMMGVARNRRRAPIGHDLVATLTRISDPAAYEGPAFRTPAQAQFWFEWRTKGWAMPAAVIFGVLVGCTIWLIFSRDAEELLRGFIVGGGLLSVAGLIGGLVLGNAGSSDSNSEIGQFLATRPMPTHEMARLILKTIAGSVFLAWMLWVAAILIMHLALWGTGALPAKKLFDELDWWYWPATLLGPWIVAAVGSSIGLAGRTGMFVKLLCGTLALYIAVTLLARYLLSPVTLLQFGHGLTITFGAAMVVATALVQAAARRRALIGNATVAVAASAWAALSALVTLAGTQHPGNSLSASIFFIGLAALAVAPLAAAPLALQWNRTR